MMDVKRKPGERGLEFHLRKGFVSKEEKIEAPKPEKEKTSSKKKGK